MQAMAELDAWVPLLDSPWSVRFGRGTRGRVALEVYNNGLLLDVLVARPLAADVLRGARRGGREGHPSVLAWGHLPPNGAPPDVRFSRRHRKPVGAEPLRAGGEFWVAQVEGWYDHVSAVLPDGGRQRLRVRAGWSR